MLPALLLLLISLANSKPLNPKKVVHAMNCGAPSTYKAPSGITYDKDIQADPESIVADYNLNSEVANQVIKYTREPEIYLTERHAYKTFGYELPLQKEGTYTLILKFAEMYFDQKKKRVFHVKLGEQRIIEDLDVVARVGKYAALDEYIEFEYIAGTIFFNNTQCVNAVKNGKLQLILEKTKFDNPYIHGIVLFQGSINETDYSDYQNLRNNWEKFQKDEQARQEQERLKKSKPKTKRKERIKIRNDHLNELENEFEIDEHQSPEVVINDSPPKFSLKQLVTGPVGTTALWIGFLVFCKIFSFVVGRIVNTRISKPEVEEDEVPKAQKAKVQQSQPQQKASEAKGESPSKEHIPKEGKGQKQKKQKSQ